jgi:UDP-N-acetylmuramyl tripeptide synthase
VKNFQIFCAGIAVEASLEDIVRGIEEVDSVPGRCELIDEEQAFAVIVDYAHSPDALSRLLDTVRECGPRRVITGLHLCIALLCTES